MTSTIIPQRRSLVAAMPPQLRRGRHALNRDRQPHGCELLDQRVARWFADRMRPDHLDVVRRRAAQWSAIAVPVAAYISVALAAVWPMNGPEHYRAAEQLVEHLTDQDKHGERYITFDVDGVAATLAAAQVHATLALAAAAAYQAERDWYGEDNTAGRDWTDVL